jgi:CRP-like cAMP-binding protein
MQYDLGALDTSGAVLLKYDSGEWLLNEGHPIEYLYILLSARQRFLSVLKTGAVCCSVTKYRKA